MLDRLRDEQFAKAPTTTTMAVRSSRAPIHDEIAARISRDAIDPSIADDADDGGVENHRDI
jgi:hypothetical protein